MGIDLLLSIVGAVTGAVGAASGYYAFILSGYRIKCLIGPAANSDDEITVKLWSPIEDAVSEDIHLMPDSLQLYIDVWNKGRMAVSVDQLRICQMKRSRKLRRRGKGYYSLDLPPIGCTGMPHRIDSGSSCRWLIPFEDVIKISEGEDAKKPSDICVRVYLGDDKRKWSKNVLTSTYIADFTMQWNQRVIRQDSSESDF